MKKLFFLLVLFSAFLSCKKTDKARCPYLAPGNVATAAEISYLQNYITADSISATQHPSGVFYTISDSGTGASPSVCSNITISYTGRVLGGAIFDQTYSTHAKLMLGELILGWQTVLPVLKTGGDITLYIPPSLGYGPKTIKNSQGVVVIPPYSYLVFEISLFDVQ